MATLREYFVKDGSRTLTLSTEGQIGSEDGEPLGALTTRVHFDFEAHAKYVSLYVEDMPAVSCPEALVLSQLDVDAIGEGVSAAGGISGEMTHTGDTVFTGQIYIYSERPVSEEMRSRLHQEARQAGHRLTFRSTEYAETRSRLERPQAFICHDSRDKKEVAEPLAIELQKLMCPVWFDGFSLKVGDSLRGEIERGLKECPKCIVILTSNFLSNSGWAKREYDSVFTRELVEDKKVILPVWHGVSASDVYEYSPVLADKVGARWELGKEEVARRLFAAITAR